jgi:hypothetical protein
MSATALKATSTPSEPALASVLSTPESEVSVTPSSWAPTAKVCAGILAASVTSLLLPFWAPLTGHDLSAPQAAAFTTAITFVIQYFVPERK